MPSNAPNPSNPLTLTLPTLPPEIILIILTHLPPLDYLPLKLTGNAYLTAVVRDYTSRLPRAHYLRALCAEDALRGNLPRYRPAMRIMLERGQEGLIRWYVRRWEREDEALGMDGWVWETRWRKVIRPTVYLAVRYGLDGLVGWLVESLVKELINVNHIKVGKRPFQKTPMHVAAYYGHVGVVEMLLRHGAVAEDLRIPDGHDRYTPLEVAVRNDHEDVVALLRGGRGQEAGFNDLVHCPLENWVAIISGEFGPQHEVCDKKEKKIRPSPHLPCIDLLRRLRVELEDNSSVSAEAFQFVLSAWSDWDHEECLLTAAIKYDSPGLAQVVLDAGYLKWWKPRNPHPGEVIFRMALTYQSENVIKLFLSRDRLWTTDNFHWAVKMGNKEVIRHFLTSGFRAGAREYYRGHTVIHLTVVRNDLPMLVFILENAKLLRRQRKFIDYRLEPQAMPPPEPADHIDVSMEDDDGCTPLHYAAEQGSVEMVKLLLEHGCFINQRDSHGNSPLDRVGKGEDKEELVRFLVERGAIRTSKLPKKSELSIRQRAKEKVLMRGLYVHN
ncbi:hypothetical protein FQN53_005480 [Emmonsiellopsis sp. PD_33]|nr:hypothetical protein FQN53_005480 [Emmonsiellopsis sp. PD_33]